MRTGPSIDLQDQPGHLIRRAHQISVATFHEALGRKVTPVQYAVLRRLQDRPGIDQATLASEVALDTSTTADIATRLEDRGWITREIRARGQRCLALTLAGSAVLAALAPGIETLQHALLDALTECEQAQFLGLLKKFVDGHDDRRRAPVRKA